MRVLQFPPKESFNRYVSFEFRYGTNGFSAPAVPDVAVAPPVVLPGAVDSPIEARAAARWNLERALNTSPSRVRERLML